MTKDISRGKTTMEERIMIVEQRLFQVGSVDKLKKNDLLYGIIIISVVGGHFYDGKTERTNPDGNLGYRFYDSTGSSSEIG